MPEKSGKMVTHVLTGLLVAAGFAGLIQQACAQGKGIDEPYRAHYKQSLKGKVVAYLPISMNFDLTQAWYAILKKDLEPLGVKLTVRDPNWSNTAAVQALTTLVAEKPDIIIAHSLDVQSFVRLIEKAEANGTSVIQINLGSLSPSTAFVGADYVDIGERNTEAVIDACKGKSNKIAIIQGDPSSASSAYNLKGMENVLAKHPEMTVVSSQSANWDAAKAKNITQTVLKQHPDVCGIIGMWDGMDIGIAAAVKEAGLTGKVFVATSGGGEQKSACDMVKSGGYDFYMSYDAPTQGKEMAALIKWILSSGMKPGQYKGDVYTTMIPITKANATIEGTCWSLDKLVASH